MTLYADGFSASDKTNGQLYTVAASGGVTGWVINQYASTTGYTCTTDSIALRNGNTKGAYVVVAAGPTPSVSGSNYLSSVDPRVFRGYFKFEGLATNQVLAGDFYFYAATDYVSYGAVSLYAIANSSAGTILIGWGDATTAFTASPDVWYRLEYSITSRNGTDTLNSYVYVGESTTPIATKVTTNMSAAGRSNTAWEQSMFVGWGASGAANGSARILISDIAYSTGTTTLLGPTGSAAFNPAVSSMMVR